MTDLDALIERARGASVDRAAASRYVRELDRWAQPPVRPSRAPLWLAFGVAVAAAATVVLVWPRGAARAPLFVGDRVAVVAAPDTAYRVVQASAGETEIAVEHGAVTARLWHGEAPHHLVLRGGGVTATATGTIYSLAVSASGPVVSVIEGSVEVRSAEGAHRVAAGTRWPAAAAPVDVAAGRVLQALPATVPVTAVALDAGDADGNAAAATAADAADAAAAADAMQDAGLVRDAHGAAAAATGAAGVPAPAVKEHWRTARLLRGQGRFADALAECVAIADAHDTLWSPIALVEAARIALGPLADPERAVRLCDRMLQEWPGDALIAETRELRCRALRQLGRGAECAPAKP